MRLVTLLLAIWLPAIAQQPVYKVTFSESRHAIRAFLAHRGDHASGGPA